MTTTQQPQRHMGQQSHEASEDEAEISTSEGICKLYYSEGFALSSDIIIIKNDPNPFQWIASLIVDNILLLASYCGH